MGVGIKLSEFVDTLKENKIESIHQTDLLKLLARFFGVKRATTKTYLQDLRDLDYFEVDGMIWRLKK